MNDQITLARPGAAEAGPVPTRPTCPGCQSNDSAPFYSIRRVPVHQVQLVHSRKAALDCRRGDVGLRFCRSCGFVWNAAFDVALMRYDEEYESTQTVSPTFNRFHERLARDLIARFELHGKTIVEVGCGQGEFITMLAEIGGNRGFGFDRVHRGGSGSAAVTFVKDFYGPAYQHIEPDFVCCKMTLEHVHDNGAFLRSMREAMGDRPDAVIFFMIPEVTRILELRAFWDVYYEHCSYYSPGALARHFRIAGFDPIDVWCDYDDQYVLIAARPGDGKSPILPRERPAAALAPEIDAFARDVAADLTRWRSWLAQRRQRREKTVLWGGGSKAVAFLTTLGVDDEIAYTVDLNPKRSGTFIASTGHRIMAPAALTQAPPDALIVLSPIYLPEIKVQLQAMGVRPAQLLSVEERPKLAAA
ncbi:MAG TPA: class I SAM-dependent methyltransferase [Geminicoccaceae bacterium]|nr:class I SAM-dependent methyltransferase [Geminicoccaceae bacterium]